MDFTSQKRNELLMDMGREMVSSAIVEGNVTIKSKRQLSQIIDTTLLKCYLQVNICVNENLLFMSICAHEQILRMFQVQSTFCMI